jgi:hypothetical protein
MHVNPLAHATHARQAIRAGPAPPKPGPVEGRGAKAALPLAGVVLEWMTGSIHQATVIVHSLVYVLQLDVTVSNWISELFNWSIAMV